MVDGSAIVEVVDPEFAPQGGRMRSKVWCGMILTCGIGRVLFRKERFFPGV